jgi:CRP-like cAMP-binding protein
MGGLVSKPTNPTSCLNCKGLSSSIFAEVGDSASVLIGQHRVINNYKKGEVIFHQDNLAFGISCMASGKVKIVKSDSNGNEAIVRLVNSGGVLGHASAFLNESYHANAVALEDCNVCYFDKNVFLEIISNSPQIALNLINQLGHTLKLSEGNCAARNQQNVREKLANLFISLKKTNGVLIENSWMLDIRLTREELASMIGSTTETVCRFITEFKQEGLILERNKTLYIVDLEKLAKFANSY